MVLSVVEDFQMQPALGGMGCIEVADNRRVLGSERMRWFARLRSSVMVV